MMTNYIERNGVIAFHPGYYIKEIVDESGLTQEDFAKRLDTTPKNLSLLMRGEQSLSIEMAVKLSRMIGTSIAYWLNIQNAYDTLVAEFQMEDELQAERDTFKSIDYKYFRDHFRLPDLPRCIDEQIKAVRSFLKVSTLCVLAKRDMAVSFRSATSELPVQNTIKANTMVQIATNKALLVENAPKYSKDKLVKAVEYILTLTHKHDEFYPLVKKALFEGGVIIVVLPNLSGSKINGATKKIGNNVMLMVNDRCMSADIFWFTLFHEIGHILDGCFGISFESESGEKEDLANEYAANTLIPSEVYAEFVNDGRFDVCSIKRFAGSINRDPGIVVGRLQREKRVPFNDINLQALKPRYKVRIN